MHKGSLFLGVFTPPPNLGGGWEGVDLTPTLSLMRRGGFNPTLTLPLLRQRYLHNYQKREIMSSMHLITAAMV